MRAQLKRRWLIAGDASDNGGDDTESVLPTDEDRADGARPLEVTRGRSGSTPRISSPARFVRFNTLYVENGASLASLPAKSDCRGTLKLRELLP